MDAQMPSCGGAVESRTHIVGEGETHKEEEGVLEEGKRGIDECAVKTFGALDNNGREKNARYRTR